MLAYTNISPTPHNVAIAQVLRSNSSKDTVMAGGGKPLKEGGYFTYLGDSGKCVTNKICSMVSNHFIYEGQTGKYCYNGHMGTHHGLDMVDLYMKVSLFSTSPVYFTVYDRLSQDQLQA